ncbi:putative baculoviral IAP repeat-containing protein 7-A-like [Apostichopus japonicus]|uniref:Putative baculoviral IAP repeat-containing protein 7-A-like n=1 Tax=Stichopus japonicus TaxID=307972 RepID=A0A2G8LN00_STIJA|nr:putative baculoviral IAP repeat-containing protein 7-A-like [Apostichopus japonicus]
MSIFARTDDINSHEKQNILKSLFKRIDTFVEKKRSLMKDGDFNRSFTGVDMEKYGNRLKTYIVGEWEQAVSMSDMSSAGFCFTGVKDTVVCFSCKGVLSSWEAGHIPIKRHIKAFPFSWPNNHFVKIKKLAKAGFYLERAGIKCFACFAEVKDLNDEDRAKEIHLKESPDCPFSKGLFTGNKEITPEELNQAKKIYMRHDKQSRLITPVQCTDPMEDITPLSVDKCNLPSEIARSDGDNPMYLKAKHKDYFREKQRLESFENWPKDHFLKPVVFAKAGFFKSDKSDKGDKVTCFYCGVNLEEWEEGDDPQNEHYVNFPNCKWLETELSMKRVKEMKGENSTADVIPSQNEENEIMSSTQQIKDTVDKEIEEPSIPDMSEDILKLGYSKEIVEHVINERLESDEIPFQDSGELLQAVMKEEEITELENKRSGQFEKSSVSSETARSETNGREKQKMEALEAKIEELKERNACKICLDEEVKIIFIPCKHLAVCEACAEKVEICPICRDHIDDKLQVFIP